MHKKLLSLFTVASLALLTAACNDSGSNVNTFSGGTGVGQQQPAPLPINPFVGRYTGVVALENGQQGFLELIADALGQATGTMTVQGFVFKDQLNAAIPINIPPGVYPVVGTVDPTTGQFTLRGSLPVIGAFTITGTLPSANNAGFFQVNTLNGGTYQGSFTSGGGQNNNNAGTNRLITSGTVTNFTFTPAGGFNGSNPPFGDSPLVGGNLVTGSSTNNGVTISISQVNLGSNPVATRNMTFGIQTQGNPLVVGQEYPIVTAAGQQGSIVTYQELSGTTVQRGWTITPNTTGSARITAMTANTVDVDFTFNNVGPNTALENNGAAGTFSTSGHVTANLSPVQ